jgi:predicted MPP superfamily phosphohydrolase
MTTTMIGRRKFLACAGAGCFGLAGYAGLMEPFRLVIGRRQCQTRFPKPELPFKILHLSDLHASWAVSLDFIEQAIRLGLQLKPDLICVTGDFVTAKYEAFDTYARVLAALPAAAPAFACLGNHDGGYWAGIHGGYKSTQTIRRLLEQSGIQLLENRAATLSLKGRDVTISGLADAWSGNCNPASAFPPAGTGAAAAQIVLSHNPDTKDFLRFYPWDLLLCGHTHGGQVLLPWLGAPWAPVRDKRFLAGLYSYDNRWIHITPGIGNVHGFRFNCPPEVSLITVV